MANWTTCPQCNYLIVNPSQPCPSCGTVVPAPSDFAAPARPPILNDNASPSDGRVNNVFMWALAFAPLVGRFIERVLLKVKYGDPSDFADILAMAFRKYEFWYVTFFLLLILLCLDLAVLKKAGYDLGKFTWLILVLGSSLYSRNWISVSALAPIYIFQRARDSGQNLICFVISVVIFIVPIMIGYV